MEDVQIETDVEDALSAKPSEEDDVQIETEVPSSSNAPSKVPIRSGAPQQAPSESESAVAAMRGMTSLTSPFKASVVKYESFVLTEGRKPSKSSDNPAEKKLAVWMDNFRMHAKNYPPTWNDEKERLLELLVELTKTRYPPVMECLVIPKEVKLDCKMTMGARWGGAFCRVSSCDGQSMKKWNFFCSPHYSLFHPERTPAPKKTGDQYPPLSNEVIVPEGVKLDTNRTFTKDGKELCRLTGCPKRSWYSSYDNFCQACRSTFHKSHDILDAEMARAHKERIERGEDMKVTLKQHFFDQSAECKGARDADPFLENGASVIHWTTVDDLANWEGNGMDAIVLMPNKYLKEATLDQYPHFKNCHNKLDTRVWGTIDLLGGKQFMQGHHRYTITPGTTWHILVFTRDSASGRSFSQFKYNGVNVSPNHELMVNAQGAKKPSLVIRVKFVDDNIYNAEMAVVRVNGDMKTEVEIDVEDPGFKITKGTISYSPPEAGPKTEG